MLYIRKAHILLLLMHFRHPFQQELGIYSAMVALDLVSLVLGLVRKLLQEEC